MPQYFPRYYDTNQTARNVSARHRMASIASILPKSQDRDRYRRSLLVARRARYHWRLGSNSVWTESETDHHFLE